MSDETRLIAPADIPWSEYRGEALEEMLYWLCDALGALDLTWRAGSATGTSRDRGRDLEATFNVPLPDGEMRPERWWLQAKGRTGTVEPAAVREAAVEVQAHGAVDVLVLATNSRFSNDTRDWVEEFTGTHARPAIRLWDRDALERMLVRHPSVVARIAPGALTTAGRIAASTSAYWNRHQLPLGGDLDRFWRERSAMALNAQAAFTVIAGEAAREGLVARPWGTELNDQLLLETLATALLNIGPLLLRAESAGTEQRPLVDAAAYLIACALTRTSAAAVAKLVEDPWELMESGSKVDSDSREKLRELLIEPIIESLFAHYGTACMTDCERMLGELEPEERKQAAHRWLELLPSSVARDDLDPDPRTLLIEKQDAPCRAGLELDASYGCPFGAVGERELEPLLAELQTIIGNRVSAVAAERAPQEGP